MSENKNDVVTGEVVGFGEAGPEQYVTVHFKDVASLVEKKGGALAAWAFKGAPQTVTNKAYSDLRDKLAAGLKAEGVDADVQITTTPPTGPRPKSDLVMGMFLGAIGGLVAGALWRHFRRK